MIFRLFELFIALDAPARGKIHARSKSDAAEYCRSHHATVDADGLADTAYLFFLCKRLHRLIQSPHSPLPVEPDYLGSLYTRLAKKLPAELTDYFAHIREHYAKLLTE